MSAHKESESFVLPPGTRALYIGPPKSGTTALQAAASAARDELYTHGVVYPGSGESHHRDIRVYGPAGPPGQVNARPNDTARHRPRSCAQRMGSAHGRNPCRTVTASTD